jgi:8-oxo-dGTP pyrophosphatase MutT (NUDIX family)
MARVTTLCLTIKDGKLLLGMKKRGFGEGNWNGFGGKLLPEESPEAAAIRELEEEAGIRATALEKMGHFTFIGKDFDEEIEVNLFEVIEYEGEPTESEEMKPKWFEIAEIPYEEMWEDDSHWLPLFLEGKKTKAVFHYENGRIIDFDLAEVSNF